MHTRKLLRAMLPGLLPLAVFIAADSFFGTTVGLITATALGTAEFIFILVREKRADLFVLFDLALIVVFAGVSLLLDNDIFFKLKPAVPEAILSVILGVSAFTPANPVQLMTKRYLKGVILSADAVRAMRRNSAVLFFITIIHTLLIVFAAYRLSTAAWGFISGVMYFILIAGYMTLIIAAGRIRRLRNNKT
jgi:intracellular septation protein A